MAKLTPDEHLTNYVIGYYGGLMTRAEWLACRTFVVEAKIEHGYDPELLADLRTDGPEALSLMSQGVESFRLHVRERILRDHRERVFLNYCPKCGGAYNDTESPAVLLVFSTVASAGSPGEIERRTVHAVCAQSEKLQPERGPVMPGKFRTFKLTL